MRSDLPGVYRAFHLFFPDIVHYCLSRMTATEFLTFSRNGYFILMTGLCISFPFVPDCTHGLLLSKSTVETCVRSSQAQQTCREKLHLTFIVDAGENGTESVVLHNSRDHNGETVSFSVPLEIHFSKKPMYVLYPLSYAQSINVRPQESIFVTNQLRCSSTLSSRCKNKHGFC